MHRHRHFQFKRKPVTNVFFLLFGNTVPFGSRCLCVIFQVSRINFSTFPCRRSSLLRLRVKHWCVLKRWLVDQSASSGHRRRAEPRRTVWLRKQCKSVTAGHSSDKNKVKGEEPMEAHLVRGKRKCCVSCMLTLPSSLAKIPRNHNNP